MTIERIKYFNNMSEEEYANISRIDFTISELKEILVETRMPPADREIAELWLIEGMTSTEIADKLYMDKRSIDKHLNSGINDRPGIRQMLKDTLTKITRNIVM